MTERNDPIVMASRHLGAFANHPTGQGSSRPQRTGLYSRSVHHRPRGLSWLPPREMKSERDLLAMTVNVLRERAGRRP
jgi:hypothetical protein